MDVLLRLFAVLVALLVIGGCGPGIPDDEALEEAFEDETFEDEALANEAFGVGPECSVFHRIVAARDDQPPFSSLGSQDLPPGALRCETRSQIEPASMQWEPYERVTHVCTLYEAPTSTARETAEARWVEVRGKAFDCFPEWEKSAAASRDDAPVGGHRTFSIFSEDVPFIPIEEENNLAPIVFDWRYQPDPTGLRPGHEIIFYVVVP